MRTLVLLLFFLATTLSASDHFAYIYRNGDVTHIRNNRGSIEKIVAKSKRWSGEYIWLERQGREYLIRDVNVLAETRAAFADMHALEPKLRAAEERVRPLEEELDRLEDHLGDDHPADSAAIEKRIEELRVRYDAAEAESERMEREQERLERIAEARFEKIVIRAIDEGKAERVD